MAYTKKRYIYLAGKIKLGHGATGYRALVAPLLRKFGIFSLDPLRGKYAMKSWKSLSPNEVVVRDLQDIDRAHCMLAVMMKCEDSSFGTPCEVMYAWLKRIPVILITNERYLSKHFWVESLCSHIIFVDEERGESVDNALKDAVQHIGHWYGADVEEEVYTDPKIVQAPPVECDCITSDCDCDNVPFKPASESCDGSDCNCQHGCDQV